MTFLSRNEFQAEGTGFLRTLGQKTSVARVPAMLGVGLEGTEEISDCRNRCTHTGPGDCSWRPPGMDEAPKEPIRE